ncbi:hypothetical protein SELR_08330 [Selenomonas ruminantium subsp. lactilytica TAM6421]|uniref:Uncharacterized protein n=1 Tax=Selenomonas ruminantium subsp. lactilytica (strain NBRC 103574 / TAM6421) TaxID=927704 RepID=I0GP54_SELRL|nr:hypothetical protein SELR_08330 [Selenomonas ruminantium subsp. lactilytica TAM6421]
MKLREEKTGYQLILPVEWKCYAFDSEGKLISLQQNNQRSVKLTYQLRL